MPVTPETVTAMLRDAPRTNTRPAYRVKRQGAWRDVSWTEVDRRVRELGDGLLSLSVGRGETVGILSQSRLEWTLCDFAVFSIGAVTVPVYPTSSAGDIAHVLGDAGVVAVICENAGQLAKLAEVRDRLPRLRHLIVIDEAGTGRDAVSLDRLAARGVAHAASHPEAFDQARAEAQPDDPLTFIYTSGTTGPAKGCVLLQRNYAAMSRLLLEVPDLVRPGDRALIFLPLAHTFARLMQFAALAGDVTICFAEGVPQVADNLRETAPEIFPTVPRVLEKMHLAVSTAFAEATGPRARLIAWALRVGRQVSVLRQGGRAVPATLAVQHAIAGRLVYAKVKARLGANIRYVVSGGAPLSHEIAEFLHALDIQVLEGYGLTECTTAATINRPHRYRFGTVGPAFPHCELRTAEDGEIEVRGPIVFAGYYGDPEATAEAVVDGWLRTGDVGEIDADGFLRITDRKKDVIVTAGGKNVAPQNVELLLKQQPGVSQAVVIGDRRPFLTALITVDPDELDGAAPGSGADAVRERVQRSVDAVNERLSDFERIRRFAILERDFSEESGELTPTLKVKRRLIAERYADTIERLYAS